MIINAFEENIFPLPKKEMSQHEECAKEEKREQCITPKEILEIISEEEKSINNDLFRYYFKYQNQSYMYENLNNTKSTERNKFQVNWMKIDLKNRFKNMFEDEKNDWKTR